ncbi:serine hydrolase [Sphingomonas crusticola]|uniref:serine hydrolase n=1 Tax=Sphingomonas crusticola TaxID=1697973 RepID=UPI001F08291E|nr:serine hydrolase [Sphingomonas crusticola]
MSVSKWHRLSALALLTTFALPLPLSAQVPAAAAFPTLAEQLATIAAGGNGRIGIAATDLDTGESFTYAARDPFPMASTVKVAIAATYLAGVDRRRFDLDQLYRRGGTVLTARRLIELMLIRSDNGAADILLQAVGGTQAVNNWLNRAGIRGQRMDRTIARLVLDDRGRPSRRVAANLPQTPQEVAQSATLTDDGEVNPAFVGDARDTSTPTAMVGLLAKLHQGVLLSPDSTRYLFEVMGRCVTGPHRIKGMLPAGTPVAHKTGTLAGVSDDVGIVSLPNGHRLALAIFAKGMRSEWERDRSIAQLARLLYDRFSAVGLPKLSWGTAP